MAMTTRAKPETRAPSVTHARAAQICGRALKSLGLGTRRAVEPRNAYDFLVDGRVRIAVRYAFPTSYREQRYLKKNGEESIYVYRRWTFNFHRHGKIDERYCDFFVCLLGANRPSGRSHAAVTVFVIPWEAITGLTFCSSVRDDNPRPYRGRYARYIDAWHLIVEAARGRAAADQAAARSAALGVSIDGNQRLRLVTAASAPASAELSGAARK